MKAVQLLAHGCPGTFELREVPDPKPGPGEVIVEVQACGLNHLDLWLEQGELPTALELPRTPGGEIAGRVREVAEDVRSWREGDAAAVQSNLFCGRCLYCQRGDESMCRQPVILGVQRDGGFAERVCVPERALVRLPAGVDFQTSAALTLAGSTAMHMLTNRVQVRPNDWVLVIGAASGVGSAAIQIARQLGARVIATASSEPKSALARRLGAEFVVDSTETNWPAAVRQITSKQGVDVVVEHVGGEVLVRALECLGRGGTVVTCGATAGKNVSLNLWSFFVRQHRLVGSYSRNRADLKATLDWAATGKLKPVIHGIFSLDRTAKAFALLRARSVLGKLLVAPHRRGPENAAATETERGRPRPQHAARKRDRRVS